MRNWATKFGLRWLVIVVCLAFWIALLLLFLR